MNANADGIYAYHRSLSGWNMKVSELQSDHKQSQMKVHIFVRIYLWLKERTYVSWPPLSCTALAHSTRAMALAHRTDLSRYDSTWLCRLDRLATACTKGLPALVTIRHTSCTLWRSLSPSRPLPFAPLPLHCSLHIVPSLGTSKRVVKCVIKKYSYRQFMLNLCVQYNAKYCRKKDK